MPYQRELRKLAEKYAIRARQLSDTVATLGRQIAAEQEIETNIMEIKRCKALADQAAEDFLAAIESQKREL